MSYNTQCNYQNCVGGCCNFYGDCPQWYSNGIDKYSNCYYYYSTKPPNIWAAIAGSIIGVLIIMAIICVCYRLERKKREEELRRLNQNGNVHFKVANNSEVTMSDENKFELENQNIQTGKLRRTSQVYPVQPHNQHIFGIGNEEVS